MIAPRLISVFTHLTAVGLLVTLTSAVVAQTVASPYAHLLPPPPLAPYPVTQTPEPLPIDLGIESLGEPTPAPPADSPAVPPAAEAVEAGAEEIELGEPVEEPPKWYHITYWLQPPGWDSGVELGVNGSSGTSDSMSLRTGGFIKRKTKERKTNFDIYHNRTKSNGELTQNNAQVNFRNDWLAPETPWTVYVQNQLYFDEYQAFDLNINMNSGVGYRFFDEEQIGLTGRVGAGASREFGGLKDEWVPEAQFGLDFEQQLSETQKFYAKSDYFPEFVDFGHFRLLTDIGWEVELLVPSNVSLKIAATDRYDSHPEGVSPHNLNYSVILLWKL